MVATSQTQLRYTRLDHFDLLLCNLTRDHAKEVPSNVITTIQDELEKQGMHPNTITNGSLFHILKATDMYQYEESSNFIINQLKGLPEAPLPTITDELKAQLRSMFNALPALPGRSSLSYVYIMHKLCEILHATEVLQCIPLPKNVNKITAYNTIWRTICDATGWAYYDTVQTHNDILPQ